MAGIGEAALTRTRTISAGQQFAAVAQLRWCLFRNGFRRKGGKGEVVARIIVFPIALLFIVGPALGAGFSSYAAASNGNLGYLAPVFWGIFILQIVVSINISQPGLNFDPESLIRFPLSFSRYLVIRLFLGLLAVSTIIGTAALLAAATGVTVAIPSLAPAAYSAAILLALCNMLFTRMVFAWVDRWLSTRRAREIFMVLLFTFSIGVQYVNVAFNGVGKHTTHAQQMARIAAVTRFYHHAEPVLDNLPPGLAAGSLEYFHAGQPVPALAQQAGIGLAAALFLSIFAWRMHREYRGENLSEASHSPVVIAPRARVHPHDRVEAAAPMPVAAANPRFGLPDVVAACFEKEWVYVRRNPAQFYGLIAPLAMVFIFAARLGSSPFARQGFIFPAAASYSVLGISALAYNVLGLDASGVQFYFLAPIRMRSVMLAKNLFGFSITAIQIVLLLILLNFTSGLPPWMILLSTLCWVVFAILVNATVGNIRSITTPKKVDPSKVSRKQASQMSALMCIGILILLAGFGAGLLALGAYLHMPWLPVPILLCCIGGTFALYRSGLNHVDVLIQKHRETLIEELSKAS